MLFEVLNISPLSAVKLIIFFSHSVDSFFYWCFVFVFVFCSVVTSVVTGSSSYGIEVLSRKSLPTQMSWKVYPMISSSSQFQPFRFKVTSIQSISNWFPYKVNDMYLILFFCNWISSLLHPILSYSIQYAKS